MNLESKKFYITPNRILDIDMIGDAAYTPKGTFTGGYMGDDSGGRGKPILTRESELVIRFKDSAEPIVLDGVAADDAWGDYQDTVDPLGRLEDASTYRNRVMNRSKGNT